MRALPRRSDVLVLGGGLAGLTAALGIAEGGLSVTLLERDRRLGGRASSWIDDATGDPVHVGPHIFLTEYPNMLALLERCGTLDRVAWQPDHFLTVVDGRKRTVWKLAPLPPPMALLPSVMLDPGLGALDKLSATRVSLFAMQMTEEDVLELDGVNAYAFLRAMGVTERNIGRLWAFMSMALLNVPVELVSAGAMLRIYRRMIGYGKYAAGFPTCGLGDLFAPQSKKLIERAGGTVALGVDVARLLPDPKRKNRVAGVELADGRRLFADRVVSTLPPAAFRKLLPREWLERHAGFAELVHFHPCPYVSPYLWFDRKLTNLRFWARSWSPNDLNCDFYDLSNLYPERRREGSLIASNIIFSHRADGMSDREIVEETRRELAEFLPAARRARLVHSRVNRIPMAIHCPFPGTERRRLDARSPVERLTLAGDWTRTGLPSSMESATASGWRAAEVVLGDAKRPVPKLVRPSREIEGLSGLFGRMWGWLPKRPIRAITRRLRAAPFPSAPF